MIKYLIVFSLVISSHWSSAQTSNISWKRLSQIWLLHSNGKSMQISTPKQTVFVMLSPECPLCRNYISVLNVLQDTYPEVAFYGIFPGKSYGPAEVDQFRKEYHPKFNLAIDPQKKLSSYFEATITPECILVNELGIITYRGLIDNWPSSLGQQRKVITERYLATALEQAKHKQTHITRQTKPIGCLINDL